MKSSGHASAEEKHCPQSTSHDCLGPSSSQILSFNLRPLKCYLFATYWHSAWSVWKILFIWQRDI